ncbi:carboxylesterase [Hyphomicrobium sp. 99]|uniref:alpha/beta hydrolase n=1 Tax=Hyphomicrobium sp. 99 TaxID=1163419 RepID=UPI0005F7FA6D|nr:alpha/beta fold hydrolase [Hyphomicrobium sp. 99]
MSAEITQLNKETTYRIAGGKVGVLLIHGLCGTPAEMRFVAMGLARAGYTVHCPTLAGHGATRRDIINTTWQDWYLSAETALDEIRKDCDTVIVGGLCLGSIIGLHLAANNRDKVQGLALFSPALWINGWAMPWYTKLFSLVRVRWMANLLQFPDAASLGIKCPRVREFVRAALAASDGSGLGTAGTPGAMLLEHHRIVSAAKKILGKIDQPVLIVHSREDDYANLNNAAYVQANLGAPADLVVLEDSYHMVTLDKERHVVVEKTRSFVERIAASVSATVAGDAEAMEAA